jgi:hypothetical protein
MEYSGVEVAIVRLVEGCRYNQRHCSHASGSACGATETGYPLCLKIVYLSRCTTSNTMSLNGTRENGWVARDTKRAQLVPLRRATLNFSMEVCKVRMASELKK